MSEKTSESMADNKSEFVHLPPDKILHIKPEGYQRTDDLEFFERLQALLEKHGYDTDNLVYSAFDAEGIEKGIKRYGSIFAMNKAGWERAIDDGSLTPPQIGDFRSTGIGFYDKSQLTEGYCYKLAENSDLAESRLGVTNVERGERLSEMRPEVVVNELVVHNDIDSSPTDALLGVVVIDQ